MNSAELNELIDVIDKLSSRDWLDYFVFIVPLVVTIITTMINVWLVNKNTNMQIENQNKETYRPRLMLSDIRCIQRENNEIHFFAHSIGFNKKEDFVSLFVNIILENIGNGIANDISFYMLNTGKECLEIQVDDREINQKINSTLEIPKDKSYPIRFLFNFNGKQMENEDDIVAGGTILLICNYKDLNNNNFKILIGCILKKYEPFKTEDEDYGFSVYNRGNFSFFYYQEGTIAYRKIINKYKTNYGKILKYISEES